MTVTPQKKKPVHVGLSITRRAVELAVFSPKTMAIEESFSTPIPAGVFDVDGDNILDPILLRELIGHAIRSVKPKPLAVHLSLPGSLLRMVEMPKMDPSGLYVSLASEAERYKSFDNTEAIVDFVLSDNPDLPANHQQLVFGAVRSDSLGHYLRILKELRVKPASISLEPLDILRGLAGTGILDGMVQQIGTEAYWGMIFVEPTRIRLSLWQADRLIELRETQIETAEFSTAHDDAIIVEDMLEEMRRTTKNTQPSLWLTHNMPPAMERILSSRLNTPFHVAPLGNAIQMKEQLQLSTLGSALSSVVQFPFDFDLSVGLSKAGGIPMASGADMSAGGEGSDVNWLVPAGVASIVIFGLITAGLFALSSYTAMQLPDLQKKRDNAKLAVANLETRQRELKKKVELDQTLLELVNKARIRNHVYVALTQDLAEKTPEKVWIHSMKVNDSMELSGKALSHQSVINLARSFDKSNYSKAILINSIKEGRLNGTLVYDFKIGGSVYLNPALLDEAAANQQPAEPGSSAEKPGSNATPKAGV